METPGSYGHVRELPSEGSRGREAGPRWHDNLLLWFWAPSAGTDGDATTADPREQRHDRTRFTIGTRLTSWFLVLGGIVGVGAAGWMALYRMGYCAFKGENYYPVVAAPTDCGSYFAEDYAAAWSLGLLSMLALILGMIVSEAFGQDNREAR